MCDYFLTAEKTRPAAVGDRLTTHTFTHSTTGFRAAEDAEGYPVAVCMRPGTEVAFDAPIIARSGMFGNWMPRASEHKVGRFRQIDLDNSCTHHDALELPDGAIVKINDLTVGQMATVLQLPAERVPEKAAHSPTPVPELTF